jgi:hypothetical protein
MQGVFSFFFWFALGLGFLESWRFYWILGVLGF